MNGKYFVCFDEFGEIESICSEKLIECSEKNCREFILKLIPIERTSEEDISEELNRALEGIKSVGKFGTKFDKVLKNHGRIIR